MEKDQQAGQQVSPVTKPRGIITSHLFEAYLKCPTKCFLQSIGEAGHANTRADWVQAQNESYRRAGVKRLVDEYPNGDCAVGPLDSETLRTAKWEIAADLVARSQNLESTIHAVEQIPSEGRGQAAQFIPIRFAPTNKLTKDDKLLLAFDALVLSEVLGREVALGKIIHGDDHTILKVKTSALAGDVRKQLGKIVALSSEPSHPTLVLIRHCTECEFRDRCRPKAIEKDDLSLIPGISQKEILKLNKKGIFSVIQLSHTYRPRRRRHKTKAVDKHSHALKALAIREKKIYVTGTAKPQLGRVLIFFDVESIPDCDFYYLIGAKVVDGADERTISLWADDKAGEERIWKEFLTLLSAFDSFSLLHFGSYELDFMSRMLKKYGGVSEITAERLKSASINILTYCYLNVYFPTYSNSLKELATYLKFQWGSPGSSGLDSIDWRQQWEASKDDALKQKLLRYNLDDCEALALLTKTVLDILGDVPKNNESIVSTDSMKIEKPYRFGRNTFVIPEFDYINKCAYFDYQRTKVYWRTDNNLKKSQQRKRKLTGRHQTFNKVIRLENQKRCPACKSRKIWRHTTNSRTIYDIRFAATGVKKWITRIIVRRFQCTKCRKTFAPDEYIVLIRKIMGYAPKDNEALPFIRANLPLPDYKTGEKYGHGVLAWVMYQVIGQRQSQENVTAGLNDIFGYGFNQINIAHMKYRAAEFYRDTYEEIKRGVQTGRLVHIDETRVSVKGITGYVWVFTNLEEVLYVYSDSREGEILGEFLKDFKGIMVTDFYTAYDSVPCLQQRCLIHLVRDFNDDLFKNPFDGEFKAMVEGFGQLLRPIMTTIDTRGLKTHFLKKHKQTVRRFFMDHVEREYSSELARKYRARLKKNRDRLFTFLDHDGVPWNNNNAENAIKGFATLRRVIGGSSTERGLRDSLKLLSIAQTLRNKNVSFLDFLKSGERSLSTYLSQVR